MHTPGPWEARPNDGQIVLNGSNCYDIQEIYNDQGGFNPDDIRLMAAAPEMLTCLTAALAAFSELDDDWRGMDATLVDQIIATNRYAIAGCLLRAEGTHEQTRSLD